LKKPSLYVKISSPSNEAMSNLKYTPFYKEHIALDAQMIEFAGFKMPVSYSSIIREHQAVREKVGLFDVSHMGEIEFKGKEALDLLQYLCPSDLREIQDNNSIYTVFCNEKGTILDDCLVFRFNSCYFMVVVNAINRAKMLKHFERYKKGFDISISDTSDNWGLLALQGPQAVSVLSKLTKKEIQLLRRFSFASCKINQIECTVSRTGYTGEDGFEIFIRPEYGPMVWKSLLEAGREYGIAPCGLGARDTLRLEARLCLYGNDIDETTTPYEAGLGWTVKLKKDKFLGKEALLLQKKLGIKRKLVGFKIKDRGIPRKGYPILDPNTKEKIGRVTSGTMSPTLKQGIGLGYVTKDKAKIGNKILIDIREKSHEAEIIKTPFYKSYQRSKI
jgi:aminomethyltransferase